MYIGQGERHVYIAECLYIFGDILKLKGRYKDAIKLLLHSINMYEKIYEKGHNSDLSLIPTSGDSNNSNSNTTNTTTNSTSTSNNNNINIQTPYIISKIRILLAQTMRIPGDCIQANNIINTTLNNNTTIYTGNGNTTTCKTHIFILFILHERANIIRDVGDYNIAIKLYESIISLLKSTALESTSSNTSNINTCQLTDTTDSTTTTNDDLYTDNSNSITILNSSTNTTNNNSDSYTWVTIQHTNILHDYALCLQMSQNYDLAKLILLQILKIRKLYYNNKHYYINEIIISIAILDMEYNKLVLLQRSYSILKDYMLIYMKNILPATHPYLYYIQG